MRRELVLIGVGMLVLIASGGIPVGGAPGTSSQSTMGYPSPADVCQQVDGTRVVGVFPTGTHLQNTETLYPGTTFRILVCSNGDPEPRGSAWTFEQPDGLTVTDRKAQFVTVEVSASSTKHSIKLANQIPEKPNIKGPTVTVQTGLTATVKPSGATVQFPDSETRTTFRTAQSNFLATAAQIRNASNALNRTASTLNASGANVTFPNQTVAVLNQTRAMESSRRKTELALFDAAKSGTAPDALSHVSALRDHERATEAAAREALTNYISALRAREASARNTVLLNFGIPFLVGALVGAGAGWRRTRSNLSEVAYDRLFRSLEYSLDQMKLPLAVAVVVFVATVAAVIALSDLNTLLHAL